MSRDALSDKPRFDRWTSHWSAVARTHCTSKPLECFVRVIKDRDAVTSLRVLRSVTFLLACILALTSCTQRAGGPTSGPTSAGLPTLSIGSVTRVLGNGSGDLLSAAGSVGSRHNRPAGLVVTNDGDILGLQCRFPALFRLTSNGQVSPVPLPTKGFSYGEMPPGTTAGTPVAAMSTPTSYVVAFDTGTVEVISGKDGAITAATEISPLDDGQFASSFLILAGKTLLQHGSAWYEVTGLDCAHPQITPTNPPTNGVIAAAQDGDGASVITDQQLVHVGADGAITVGTSWTLPAAVKGQVLTAATSDGSGGLYVTASPTGVRGTNGSGSVLHIRADGSPPSLPKGHGPLSAPAAMTPRPRQVRPTSRNWHRWCCGNNGFSSRMSAATVCCSCRQIPESGSERRERCSGTLWVGVIRPSWDTCLDADRD